VKESAKAIELHIGRTPRRIFVKKIKEWIGDPNDRQRTQEDFLKFGVAKEKMEKFERMGEANSLVWGDDRFGITISAGDPQLLPYERRVLKEIAVWVSLFMFPPPQM
jgi:hypothetical protein